jgi:hypothetical protein
MLLLHAIVHPADIQDRDGGVIVPGTLHTQAIVNSICEAYSEYGRCKNTEEEDSKVQEYSENVPAVFRD